MKINKTKKFKAIKLTALTAIFVAFAVLACGCAETAKELTNKIITQDTQSEDTTSDIGENTQKNNKKKSDPIKEKAEKILDNMTLDEKIWQMFFVRPEDIIDIEIAIQAGDKTKQALENCPVGGIIYFAQNIKDENQLKNMISSTQSYSKTPLFIAVDEEGGRVARLGNAGLIKKQQPMAQIGATGDFTNAATVGTELGEGLKEFGFNVDFAPVADVITVANNEDIGDRSFGTDPKTVAAMVAAEVTAMQDTGVSSTLKHFPSNGSIVENTHERAGVCTRTYEQMKECEFIPFKAGIQAGADFIMVAHMGIETVENGTPATLSKTIINDWLREELNFKNIVISDALNMGAITSNYTPAQSATKAVNAGVDFLLMSPAPTEAFNAIKNEVLSGNISEERINESVNRIITLKLNRGVIK